MSRAKNAEELVHWLEVGEGARWIRLAAVLVGTLVLSLLIAWKQFHGPVTETTLLQADVGRQLARGEGFSTLVNFPQTEAFLRAQGGRFDSRRPYPELHQAPLYSLLIAAALRVLPATQRTALFASPPVPPDGFAADYFLLAINLILLWLAAWLTYDLGRRLFDPRAGWLAAMVLLLSMPIWQQAVAVQWHPAHDGAGAWGVLALAPVACRDGCRKWRAPARGLALGAGRRLRATFSRRVFGRNAHTRCAGLHGYPVSGSGPHDCAGLGGFRVFVARGALDGAQPGAYDQPRRSRRAKPRAQVR